MGKDERARAKREREFYRREELRRRKAKAADAPASRDAAKGGAKPFGGPGLENRPNRQKGA